MTQISDNARKVFDALPIDGSKLSGGKVKDRTRLNTTEFTDAKAELKKAGLVVLGRGRGGSLARAATDVELPEAPQKKTNEEALEIAREEKAHLTRQQKEYQAMREHVESVGWGWYPDADDIRPGLYEDRYYVEVWRGKTASVRFLVEEDLL